MRVKDSKYKYVIVLLSYYRRYKENAFIEVQAQTNDYVEANHIKVSFENAEKTFQKLNSLKDSYY